MWPCARPGRPRGLTATLAATLAATAVLGCDSTDDQRTPPSDDKAAEMREPHRSTRVMNRVVVPLAVEPQMPAGARLYEDYERRVRVTLPTDWHRATAEVAPRLGLSGEVLAVGSFPIARSPHGSCSQAPDQPQVRVGPRDALVFVEEDTHAHGDLAPLRPRRFRLWRQVGPFDPTPDAGRSGIFPWGCLNRVGIAGLWTFFRDGNRVIYVTAIVGKAATAKTQSTTLAVLNSLMFQSR